MFYIFVQCSNDYTLPWQSQGEIPLLNYFTNGWSSLLWSEKAINMHWTKTFSVGYKILKGEESTGPEALDMLLLHAVS